MRACHQHSAEMPHVWNLHDFPPHRKGRFTWQSNSAEAMTKAGYICLCCVHLCMECQKTTLTQGNEGNIVAAEKLPAQAPGGFQPCIPWAWVTMVARSLDKKYGLCERTLEEREEPVECLLCDCSCRARRETICGCSKARADPRTRSEGVGVQRTPGPPGTS